MDLVRHNLLDLLRQALLQCLRYNAFACGMRDLARRCVGAGVVGGVGELVFDGHGDLCSKESVSLGRLLERGKGEEGGDHTFSWTLPGTWESTAWETP